jgi:hypothetical protein
MNERTPLLRSGRHVAYVDAGLDGGGDADDERLLEGDYEDSDDEAGPENALRKAALKREEDAVFGKWPWRLFNRHVRTMLFRLFFISNMLFCSGGGGMLNPFYAHVALTILITKNDHDILWKIYQNIVCLAYFAPGAVFSSLYLSYTSCIDSCMLSPASFYPRLCLECHAIFRATSTSSHAKASATRV